MNDFYYVKAGLRERWTPLGHTVLYGEYEKFNNDVAFGGATNTLTGSNGTNCDQAAECTLDDMQLWGFGVVQEIDAAAMSIWVSYRHISTDISDHIGTTGEIDTEDFQYVKAGALINF